MADNKKAPPARVIALGGALTALALIFSYVEMLIPFSIGVPGIKLGLANTVIVYALYKLGDRYAFFVNICRIILSGLLFGSVFSTLYALSGGLLSFAVMAALKKWGIFSEAGVSMGGGVAHNLGQLLVAMFVVKTPQVMAYFPVLVFAGIAAGILNGIIAKLCLDRTEKIG